jgi:hypothetical protein
MLENMRLDLRMFDGAGAGGAGSGAGGEGAAAGVGQEAAAPDYHEYKRAQRRQGTNVRYGKQPEAPQQTQQEAPKAQEQAAAVQEQQTDPAQEWNDIRNNRFKAQFDADVQTIVQNRLKNSKEAETNLGKLAPILQGIAAKYGVKDANDIDALVAAYNDDDSLYEQEAMEKGVSVDTLKLTKQLERDREAFAQQQQAAQQQEMFNRHLQSLAQQAEELKKTYPQFDLRTELQNERFARMTSPNGGVSVADAFYAIHHQELQNSAMQYAVQRTQTEVANAIQAGQKRPVENGSRTQTPGLDIRSDPSKLKLADFRRIRDQMTAGEKIGF